MSMDKFGVNEGVDQAQLEKTAAQGCPQCGSDKVQVHGAVLMCPNCGSQPWEADKGGK